MAAELLQGRDNPYCLMWHLFYFERPLRSTEKDVFGERIRSFFAERASFVRKHRELQYDDPVYLVHDMSFDDSRGSAQFSVGTWDGDESWFSGYLNLTRSLSKELVGVASFNGHRVPGTERIESTV
jgi:hypothetical protein